MANIDKTKPVSKVSYNGVEIPIAGGTSDYESLTNKPAIEGFTLTKDTTLDEINAYNKSHIDNALDNKADLNLANVPDMEFKSKFFESGSNNYHWLEDKPAINGKTLTKDTNTNQLDLYTTGDVESRILQSLDDYDNRFSNSKAINKVIDKMRNGETVKIVCYGDSITYGYVPFTGAQNPDNYPKVLQENMREYYNNPNITIINKGTSGWQTIQAVANVKTSVVDLTPDLCFVMFGINDIKGSSFGPAIPKEDTIYNLSSVLEELKNANIASVLLTPTPLGFVDTQPTFTLPDKSRALTETVKYIAGINEVMCLDVFDIVQRFIMNNSITSDPVNNIPDGVHLTSYAYVSSAIMLLFCKVPRYYPGDIIYACSANTQFIPSTVNPNYDTPCFGGYKAQPYFNNVLIRTSKSIASERRYDAVNIFFWCDWRGAMSIDVSYPTASTGDQGANTGFRINGNLIRADFYSANLESKKITIGIRRGYNVLSLRATDCTETTSSYKNMFLSGIKFNPMVDWNP